MELREKLAKIIAAYQGHEEQYYRWAEPLADRILAIPEIAEALEYLREIGGPRKPADSFTYD